MAAPSFRKKSKIKSKSKIRRKIKTSAVY